MKIKVSNLDTKTTEAELRKAFTAFGAVESCGLSKDKETNKPNQQGWAVMKDDKQANAAIAGLEGSKLGGRNISVSAVAASGAPAAKSAGADRKH